MPISNQRKNAIEGKKMNKLLIIILTCLTITACNREETAQQGGARGFAGREEIVILADVVPRDLNEYIRLSGVLEGKTDISFNAEVSGRVVELFKRLGDSVSQGETIGRIDNEDLEIQVTQAEAAVLAAEAGFLTAEVVYQSNVELYNDGSISTIEYHNSLSAFKNAQATLQGARATLENRRRALLNSHFNSPVSGVIVDLPIRVGQTITVGQKIAGIVDLQTLVVRTGVGESAIRSISRGQTASITHRSSDDVFTGRVVGVGYKPLANVATFPIEIEINNRDRRLLPGLVVNIEILSYINRGVIYMLLSNVLREFDTTFVYVVDAQNTVHRRDVVLGKQINENVIIESGLSEGDRLVIEGHDRIRDGARVVVREF